MGELPVDWVWHVIERVGSSDASNSDAAVLGNLLEKIRAQTTRLGNNQPLPAKVNAISGVPSRTLPHPRHSAPSTTSSLIPRVQQQQEVPLALRAPANAGTTRLVVHATDKSIQDGDGQGLGGVEQASIQGQQHARSCTPSPPHTTGALAAAAVRYAALLGNKQSNQGAQDLGTMVSSSGRRQRPTLAASDAASKKPDCGAHQQLVASGAGAVGVEVSWPKQRGQPSSLAHKPSSATQPTAALPTHAHFRSLHSQPSRHKSRPCTARTEVPTSPTTALNQQHQHSAAASVLARSQLVPTAQSHSCNYLSNRPSPCSPINHSQPPRSSSPTIAQGRRPSSPSPPLLFTDHPMSPRRTSNASLPLHHLHRPLPLQVHQQERKQVLYTAEDKTSHSRPASASCSHSLLREMQQLSLDIPGSAQGSSKSPRSPGISDSCTTQERVINQDEWLSWKNGEGPVPGGALGPEISETSSVGTPGSGQQVPKGYRLSHGDSRKEMFRLSYAQNRVASRRRSSMRRAASMRPSDRGSNLAVNSANLAPHECQQCVQPFSPDNLPSESSMASIFEEQCGRPQDQRSLAHTQSWEQRQSQWQHAPPPRRLSNLGVRTAHHSSSVQNLKAMEGKQAGRRSRELMEQGVPLSWLDLACTNGEYSAAHTQGAQVVRGIGRDLQQGYQRSWNVGMEHPRVNDQGGNTPAARYAAMQCRIQLHQENRNALATQPNSAGQKTPAAGAADAKATPGSAPEHPPPPLVSWAAAWKTGLQAHYDMAMEKAKYKLERQAMVARANLGVGTSCAPTPHGPRIQRPSISMSLRDLKPQAATLGGHVSFKLRNSVTGNAGGLAPSLNSSVTSLFATPAAKAEGTWLGFEQPSRAFSTSGYAGVPGDSKLTPGSPAGVPDALLQQVQEAASINAALQLLDGYSQLSLEVFGQEGGAAAVARIRGVMELEAIDSPEHQEGLVVPLPFRKHLRRPLAPQEFPSGAAWSYLSAAQASRGGLSGIEGSVKAMHAKMKVMVEREGQKHGLAATPALFAVEESLDVRALSTVRSLRHQAYTAAHSPLSSWIPPPCYSHHSVATPPTSAHIAQGSLQRMHLADQSCRLLSQQQQDQALMSPPQPEQVHDWQGPGQGRHGFQPDCGPQSSSMQANSEACADHKLSHPVPMANDSWAGRADAGFGDGFQDGSMPDQGQPPSPKGVSSATGIYTVSSIAPPVPEPAKQGPLLESLWWWLEDLMVEMHGCESMRLKDFEMESAAAAHAGHEDGCWYGPGTHSSSPLGSPQASQPNMFHFDATKPTHHAKAHASKVAELAAAAANAMRAAGAKFTDPDSLPRILYFMMHLIASIEQGCVPHKDAGFLLSAGMELLLGEVAWLASHLHLAQGPNSPHLRVLHAALSAYECQADYSTRLNQYAGELRTLLEKTMERAQTAEEALEAADSRAQGTHSQAASLAMQCKELERENRQLKAQVTALEDQLQQQEWV